MDMTHSQKETGFAVKTSYAIAWQDYSPQLSLLDGLAAGGRERLPFLVYGPALSALDEGRETVFTEDMLADGILFVWRDKLSEAEVASKPLWQKFLGKVAEQAGCKNATDFIEARAAVLREDVGYEASAKLLQTGLSLSARDSLLRAKTLIEQFFAWRGVLDGKRWQELNDILGKVDLRKINQEQGETVVTLGVCSMYFLGEKKRHIDNYLNKLVYMMVYDMGYRKLVKAILDDNLLEEDVFLALRNHMLHYEQK